VIAVSPSKNGDILQALHARVAASLHFAHSIVADEVVVAWNKTALLKGRRDIDDFESGKEEEKVINSLFSLEMGEFGP
jgi:hypothetical protein